MRQLVVLAGVAVVILIGGCATGEWVHPEKPKDEFAQDYRICEQRVYSDPKLQQGSKYLYVEAIERCIKKEGWVFRQPE
ncbi:hypothetical protein [Nitrospira sp. Kam-Ns4a]